MGRISLATLVGALTGNNLVGEDSLWGQNAPDKTKEIFVKIKTSSFDPPWHDFLISNKGIRILLKMIYVLERNREAEKIRISNTKFITLLAGTADGKLYNEVEKLYGEGGVQFGVRAIYGRLSRANREDFGDLRLDMRALRLERSSD